jgi:hypothetical protein
VQVSGRGRSPFDSGDDQSPAHDQEVSPDGTVIIDTAAASDVTHACHRHVNEPVISSMCDCGPQRGARTAREKCANGARSRNRVSAISQRVGPSCERECTATAPLNPA